MINLVVANKLLAVVAFQLFLTSFQSIRYYRKLQNFDRQLFTAIPIIHLATYSNTITV